MADKNGALLRQLRHLYLATIALFLCGIALGVFVFVDSGNKAGNLRKQQVELASQQRALAAQQHAFRAEQVKLAALAKTTNKSLCNLRHDLELRVAAAKTYLRLTPHAIPGIAPAQIRANIANQSRTISSLDDLRCGRAPPS